MFGNTPARAPERITRHVWRPEQLNSDQAKIATGEDPNGTAKWLSMFGVRRGLPSADSGIRCKRNAGQPSAVLWARIRNSTVWDRSVFHLIALASAGVCVDKILNMRRAELMLRPWGVLDLFSGAGGMSYGFHANKRFQIVGAVDFEVGKPSYGAGSLECNQTYQANMGVAPLNHDIAELKPKDLEQYIRETVRRKHPVDVLISCAPCTGFSRTNAHNHLRDDPRNSLVTRSALFVEYFLPKIFLMENARELLRGNFTHHYEVLRSRLEQLGYRVHAASYFLTRFGLPQKRERAFVIATRGQLPLRTLDDLWRGYEVSKESVTIRRAIGHLPEIEPGSSSPDDTLHVCPRFLNLLSRQRIASIPHNGGSWADLLNRPGGRKLLTPAMQRSVAKHDFGSHPDVYGRLWWDRPAVTIKRECGHIGNGRYAHPEQDRLLSVREMSLLQGFPLTYIFRAQSISNMYRHIGDAVPPLISYQLSKLCEWILTKQRPRPEELILPGTHLTRRDILDVIESQPSLPFSATG